jgi:hypothetical protein
MVVLRFLQHAELGAGYWNVRAGYINRPIPSNQHSISHQSNGGFLFVAAPLGALNSARSCSAPRLSNAQKDSDLISCVPELEDFPPSISPARTLYLDTKRNILRGRMLRQYNIAPTVLIIC